MAEEIGSRTLNIKARKRHKLNAVPRYHSGDCKNFFPPSGKINTREIEFGV